MEAGETEIEETVTVGCDFEPPPELHPAIMAIKKRSDAQNAAFMWVSG